MENLNYLPEEIQIKISRMQQEKTQEKNKKASRFSEIPGGKIKQIKGDKFGQYKQPANRDNRKDYDCESFRRLKTNLYYANKSNNSETYLTLSHIGIDERQDARRIRQYVKRELNVIKNKNI